MKRLINYFIIANIITITAVPSNFINLRYPTKSLIYKPHKLKTLISGGIMVVTTYEGFDLLHLKSKPLTTSQKERIEQLKSLGYVSGPFAIEGIIPVLKMPVDLAEINEIIILITDIKKHNFSVRLAINNYREECLYHKELKSDALLNNLKEKNVAATFKINLLDLDEPIIISVEFKSCDMSIKEVQIR